MNILDFLFVKVKENLNSVAIKTASCDKYEIGCDTYLSRATNTLGFDYITAGKKEVDESGHFKVFLVTGSGNSINLFFQTDNGKLWKRGMASKHPILDGIQCPETQCIDNWYKGNQYTAIGTNETTCGPNCKFLVESFG